MIPLTTLVDDQPRGTSSWLPKELRRLYDGDLRFATCPGRPTVIANFVSSLDGVVSLNTPGHSGGGDVSGCDTGDRLVMGILRAAADAVIVGAGTLHGDSGHVRIPGFIAPELEKELLHWRAVRELPPSPLNVIVTASGHIDLSEPTFHAPDLTTVIMTTADGQKRLRCDHGDRLSVTQVRIVGHGVLLNPRDILKVLSDDFDVRLLLHEGGPRLFSQFLQQHLVDELFLTVAPQLIGRSADTQRRSLVEGVAFTLDADCWWRVIGEKASGSYRYFRFAAR